MNPLSQRARSSLGLLWLAGVSLRLTVLAVPPLLPAIHRSLHLDEATVGGLTSLPVLLLAAGAVPGSLLVARVGARRALLTGLGLVAVAGALRGLGPATPMLLVMTLVMGAGIAVSQPSLPSLVRLWFPHRVGLATAVYSNGFLMGEVAAAALTVPLVLPLVGGSWELACLVWSVPVALTLLALTAATPHLAPEHRTPPRWWPDWGSARTWRLGLILGCASAAYFGSNAFIPDYLKATHHPGLVTAALTGLNLSQLLPSALAATFPDRLIGHRWPVLLAGALTIAAALGFRMGGEWVVVWAAVLGAATALVFVLSLALPPLLADGGDVHRLSAGMFTIAYSCPFVASLAGGAIWDLTGIPVMSFLPEALAGALMIFLVSVLKVTPVPQRALVSIEDSKTGGLP